MAVTENIKQPKKAFTAELDRLESKMGELRILYEQHFVDVLPQPPLQLQKEVVKLIRQLLKAPFKNSADRFRLRMLVQRYQSYHTYWERVNKQREDGTYNRDLFKAEMRDRMAAETAQENSQAGRAEKGLKQLFSSYETAVKRAGGDAAKLNFESFKKNLLKKAKQLKEQHGVKKLHYKIVVKNGKVVVKASGQS